MRNGFDGVMMKARQGLELIEQTTKLLAHLSEYNDGIVMLIREITEASLRQQQAVQDLMSAFAKIKEVTEKITTDAEETERSSRALGSLSVWMRTYMEIALKRFC